MNFLQYQIINLAYDIYIKLIVFFIETNKRQKTTENNQKKALQNSINMVCTEKATCERLYPLRTSFIYI